MESLDVGEEPVKKMGKLDTSSTSVSIHTFSDKIMDATIYFQVIKMCDSFHLWIGNKPTFGDMAVAMQTKFSSVPVASAVLGSTDSPCVSMAQRLAKKTGKQVFVSGNMEYNQITLPLIEKRIGEELKKEPGKFHD